MKWVTDGGLGHLGVGAAELHALEDSLYTWTPYRNEHVTRRRTNGWSFQSDPLFYDEDWVVLDPNLWDAMLRTPEVSQGIPDEPRLRASDATLSDWKAPPPGYFRWRQRRQGPLAADLSEPSKGDWINLTRVSFMMHLLLSSS